MFQENDTPLSPAGEDDPIWYVYLRSDGSFQGSGVTKYDDEYFDSTLIPNPPYEDFVELPYFIVETQQWEIRSLIPNNPEPEEPED